MFKRSKNDKGKQSQQTRMKISQKLKAKARGIRKAAGNLNTVKGAKKDIKNVYSKGLEKGMGGLGYAAGLATPKLSKDQEKKALQKAEQFSQSKSGQKLEKGLKKAFDASNTGTRIKAVGSLYKGAAKGVSDRQKLGEKKDKFKSKFMGK